MRSTARRFSRRNNKNNMSNRSGVGSNRAGLLIAQGPSAGMSTYVGPSRLPAQINPPSQVVELKALVLATATAGGVIDVIVNSATVRTIANDFGDWDNVYGEYRVLALRMEYHPGQVHSLAPGSSATNNVLPFWTIVTRDTASAVSAYANIINNDSLRVYPLNRPWTREAKMNSTEEASYTPVSADPDADESYQIKAYADTLTLSQAFGHFIYRYIVQFRTRV